MVLGLVPQAAFAGGDGRVNALLRWISERAGITIVLIESTYRSSAMSNSASRRGISQSMSPYR